MQNEIIEQLKVKPEINVHKEISTRIQFLKNVLLSTKSKGFVLGISGGVDSATAGRLAQLAVEELRDEGVDATFTAMRLPYGTQADEDEAQLALKTICADNTVTFNIKPGVDGLFDELRSSHQHASDFVKGNIKARARMTAQYAVANTTNSLVIGTDHSAEAVMGFYTKFGDGACDVAPLFGLNKRQVRALAKELGFSEATYNKAPTADLEEERPQIKDEEVLGVSYNDIDDFLEGKEVNATSLNMIVGTYKHTAHKRTDILTIYNYSD